MRITYAIVVLLIIGVIGIFALENRETMTLTFFRPNVSCPRSLMIGIVYLLGMLSGWIVVGLMRRLLNRVAEAPAA